MAELAGQVHVLGRLYPPGDGGKHYQPRDRSSRARADEHGGCGTRARCRRRALCRRCGVQWSGGVQCHSDSPSRAGSEKSMSSQRPTCRGTRKDGSPCGSFATSDSGYCVAHSGQLDMAEIGRRGGQARETTLRKEVRADDELRESVAPGARRLSEREEERQQERARRCELACSRIEQRLRPTSRASSTDTSVTTLGGRSVTASLYVVELAVERDALDARPDAALAGRSPGVILALAASENGTSTSISYEELTMSDSKVRQLRRRPRLQLPALPHLLRREPDRRAPGYDLERSQTEAEQSNASSTRARHDVQAYRRTVSALPHSL